MNIPRIVIAGTNSGCGKTTLSIGLMAALKKRGLEVQPFKIGPDYIDPMFHTFVTGKDSRNLDSWLLEEDTIHYLFEKNASGAGIAVIEGVMGLYDGIGKYSLGGSTAHVSKIIHSPVILVVNGESLSLSIVPLIQGFCGFDKDVDIKGVIINKVGGEAHYRLLKGFIEDSTDLFVAGYMPHMPECSLDSRHLGLITAGEISDLNVKIDALAEQIGKTVDLELILKLSGFKDGIHGQENPGIFSPNLSVPGNFDRVSSGRPIVKIAVAKDKAFSFYYKDSLELLETLGAQLCYFSPINDRDLPDDIDGILIGGGYPEVWASELQDNSSMRGSIKKKIEQNLPAYAECGGLMYLSEAIKDIEGKYYEMAGVIPGVCEITKSLQRFGYAEIEVTEDNVISQKGDKIKTHEFHFSEIGMSGAVPKCFKITRGNGDPESWHCGFKIHNLIAGYPHLHFWSNTGFAENFIRSCSQYRSKKME